MGDAAKGHEPCLVGPRLSVVRGFASWLQTLDQGTEVPPKDILPASRQRAVPYLYTDAEVGRIIVAAGRPGRAVPETYTALVGLLAVTGARVGEAIRLDRDDVELTSGVVRVKHSKFGKSRELLLHRSSVAALRHYRRPGTACALCQRPRPSSSACGATG